MIPVAGAGSVPLVFVLPDITQSVRWRPYSVATRSGTLLMRALARARAADGRLRPAIVICRTEHEAARVRDAGGLDQGVTTLCRTDRLAPMLLAIAAQYESSCVCVPELAVSLMPPGFCRDLLNHHVRHGNTITYAADVPGAANATIAHREFLEFAAGLPRELPTLSDYVRALKSVDLPAVRGLVRSKVFSFCRTYSVSPRDVPMDVPLYDERLVNPLVAVLDDHSADDPATTGGLACYKRRLLAARRSMLRRPAGPTMSITGPARQDDAATRVLFVSGPSGFSGGEESLSQMIGALARRKVSAVVVTAHEGRFTDRLGQSGAQVIVAGRPLAQQSIETFMLAHSVIAEVRPDVVHANEATAAAFYATALADGIPVVQHVRTTAIAGMQDTIEHADAVVCVSEFVKQHVLRLNVDPAAVRVIHNGVDLERFPGSRLSSHEPSGPLAKPSWMPRVLCIARIAARKGHALLLEAIARVRARLGSIELVLVGESYGDGVVVRALRAQIASLGLDETVRWLGFVPDVRPVLATADVLVSCGEDEPLSRAVLEAMASHVPVIASDAGGHPEMIVDGVSGLLVPLGDAAALARALECVLTDRALSTTLAARARRAIAERFTIDACAAGVAALYGELIDAGLATATARPSVPACDCEGEPTSSATIEGHACTSARVQTGASPRRARA